MVYNHYTDHEIRTIFLHSKWNIILNICEMLLCAYLSFKKDSIVKFEKKVVLMQ